MKHGAEAALPGEQRQGGAVERRRGKDRGVKMRTEAIGQDGDGQAAQACCQNGCGVKGK